MRTVLTIAALAWAIVLALKVTPQAGAPSQAAGAPSQAAGAHRDIRFATAEAGIKFLNERSPLSYVEKIKRPLLIAQGANDPRVKQGEADQRLTFDPATRTVTLASRESHLAEVLSCLEYEALVSRAGLRPIAWLATALSKYFSGSVAYRPPRCSERSLFSGSRVCAAS